MDKKIILNLIMFILMINIVNALEFDNTKEVLTIQKDTALILDTEVIEYNYLWTKYPPVEIKNSFGLGETLFKGAITKHTDICGNDCSSIVKIYIEKEGTLIDDIIFYKVIRSYKELIKINDYKIYIKVGDSETGKNINSYGYVCTDTKNDFINGTKNFNCGFEIIGTKKELVPIYEEYKLGTKKPAGVYEVKITGNKNYFDAIDWVIKTNGHFINEWAEWGSGGNITYHDGEVIHTFLINGTFNITTDGIVKILVVAGGGAGGGGNTGGGGGGGAGGLIYNNSYYLVSGSYNVVVGVGGKGIADNAGGNGTNSSFGNLVAVGGGGGGANVYEKGIDGGSGGGGGTSGGIQTFGGLPYLNQGYAGGGNNNYKASPYPTGAGGGSAQAGQNATASNTAGSGGNGTLINITGSNIYYSAGGGGSTYFSSGIAGFGGSLGGGGNGSAQYTGGNANGYGSGGGGGGQSGIGGNGSNGIVIVRYTTPADLPTISLLYPPNNFFTTSPILFLSCKGTSEVGMLNLSLMIPSPFINYTIYNTTSPQNLTINQSYTFSEGVYDYSCKGSNTAGQSSTMDYTFTIDYTAPFVNITYPLNNQEFLIKTDTANITFSGNATDNIGLDSCGYFRNTFFSVINYVTCGQNYTYNLTTYGSNDNQVLFFANDTTGNSNYSSYVRVFINRVNDSLTRTSLGALDLYTIYLSLNASNLSTVSSTLTYNNTVYPMTEISNDGIRSLFSYNVTTPNVSAVSTIYYYANYTINGKSLGTSIYNHTVYNFNITDCAVGSGKVILNLSLKDEELNSYVNITSPNIATIELELNVSKRLNQSISYIFSKKWLSNNTVSICVPENVLNFSSYKIDFTIGFDSTDRVREFYYLDNGTLDNSGYFNPYTSSNINLMNLKSADSTTFLFSFTDENNLDVKDAIVHTYRKYIGEGVFREVERSKQDNNGESHVHLVEEDVIYYFMITQYGNIIFTSSTYNAKCLSTPCTILLSASPTEVNWNLINNEGRQYSITSNRKTRIVTTTFSLDSSKMVNMTLYRVLNGNASYINQTGMIASSGTLSLFVPYSYGNYTFFVAIYEDGEYIKSVWVDLKEDARDYFGSFGAWLGGLMVLALILMAVTEGAGLIVFAVLALIMIGVMGLVNLGWMALISIICAGGIIVMKLISRRRK